MRTLTLISGQWMPSRLRYPLLLLLPLILLAPGLLRGEVFLPQPPITQEPLASEYPDAAWQATDGSHRVATDRNFPILTDELEIQRQVQSGTLPTWNPNAGIGTPLAAGSMANPWYPLRWPFFFMDPAKASVWRAMLSMVLAGLGMLMFLEGRGLKFTAAFLAAVTFQSSGFVVANLHYLSKVDALLWAPWCLWGVDLIYRGRKNAGLILAASLGLSGLSGFPPVFAFVLIMTLAWILVRALESMGKPDELDGWSRSLKSSLTFATLGLCLAAVHLVPMAEAAQFSARGAQEARAIQAQSLPNGALASTLLPMAFGHPTDAHPAVEEAGTWFWTEAPDPEKDLAPNRLEWQLFAGLTALCLALGAVFSEPRRSLFPLGLLLLTWGFVFDWPGMSFLYGLPGANLGSPARAAGLGAIAIAWLAAQGFDSLLTGRRAARVGTLLGAVLGGVFGLWLWLRVDPETWGTEISEHLLTQVHPQLSGLAEAVQQTSYASAERLAQGGLRLMCLSFGVALLSYFAGRLTVRGGGVAGCLLLLFEGSLAGMPQTTFTDLGELDVFPPSQTIAAIAEVAGEGRVLRVDESPSGVGEVIRLARPNMLNAYGVRDLTPYQALPSGAMRDVWSALDPQGLYRTGVSRLSDPGLLDRPILDMLNVSCVLATHEVDHPRLTERFRTEQFIVYARAGALGPVRIIPRIVLGEPSDLQKLVSSEHLPGIFAYGPQSIAPLGGTEFVPGTWKVVRPSASRIDVMVAGTSGGFLVFHEGWMPDWKATIDGQDTQVLRLDHIFLGIQLPAGDSIVRIKYEPWSLRLGAFTSIGALLLTFLLTRGRHFRVRARDQALVDHASANPR